MLIGIPKEIKNHEYRVGATPAMVATLVYAGHEVMIETSAGAAIGFSDESYSDAGARVVASAKEAYEAEMVIKVKEPQSVEYPLLKEGQILFTFLHLAPDPEQTKALLERKVIGIAYETVTDDNGRLPLLTPMSEVAGRFAIQAGATALQMVHGGRGILLGGIPGVSPGKVVIIGGGVVGTEALKMALGLHADVTILDRNVQRLRELDATYSSAIKTRFSTQSALEEEVCCADLVIGAVLIPGKKAPKLVSREMLGRMKKGSVIVDVAIDQGGCFATSKPTTHSDPTYVVDGIVHYCVANMPGACARTSTEGLTNVTLPFALQIANLGYKKALTESPHLRNGLNVHLGEVTNQQVAEDLGYPYMETAAALHMQNTH